MTDGTLNRVVGARGRSQLFNLDLALRACVGVEWHWCFVSWNYKCDICYHLRSRMSMTIV